MKTLDISKVSAIQKALEEALARSIANPISQEERNKRILGLKFTNPTMPMSPEVIQALLQVRLPDSFMERLEKKKKN